MEFNEFLKQAKEKKDNPPVEPEVPETQDTPETEEPVQESEDNAQPQGTESNEKGNGYYYNMLNPDTGRRYDIPMLSVLDPGYFYKYVYYMKLKETSPSAFDQVMGWN